MANANSTVFVSKSTELHEEEYWWGKFYRGTEAAFVAAGLIKPEWFPGKQGNAKTSVRVGMIDGEMQIIPFRLMATQAQHDDGLISISKYGKEKFKVCISWKKDEKQRRDEEQERQSRMKEIERLHAEKNRKLELAPKNAADFLNSRKNFIRPVLEHLLNMFRRADNGYHYSREVVAEAYDLIVDLISLAENGKVYFDQKRHQYFMDDVEKEAAEYAAKEFPEFSAFMATTLAIGKAALLE